MENILTLEHVFRQYPDFRLQDISFQVPAGSIMGFIGENGAGKSTTIKLILNMLRRDSGRITVFGQDNIKEERRIKEELGVVLGELNIPDNMNAGQLNRVLRRVYGRWNEETFAGLLRRFGLKEGMAVKEYSKGMRMKLAIAAALSHDARLLLLDEPTSGLDPVVRDEILDLFLEFIQDESHSILVSSHIVGDLEKIADYITLIHRGKLLFSEEKDLLKERYRIIRGPEEAFAVFDPKALTGHRRGRFGSEALLDREAAGAVCLPEGMAEDPAGIEDIMLFHVKGERV